MCRLCEGGKPAKDCPTRVDRRAATSASAADLMRSGAHSPAAQRGAAATMPKGLGEAGRKVLIKGGVVLSVDPAVGNFAKGDLLIDGANLDAPDAAVIDCNRDAGRRTVLGYFEGCGDATIYPGDARRLKKEQRAADGLYSMAMGGKICLPGHEEAWKTGRELGMPIPLHVVGTFGMQPTFDALAASGQFGADNIFIHMTGMSDMASKTAADAGTHLSLSSDVECTMAANENTLAGKDHAKLMSSAGAVRHATIEGAKALRLDHKTGPLSPGKEADVILPDAEALNVAPLNHAAGAVATLMDRTNVDTVFVAGQVRKWKGTLPGHDIPRLCRELEKSRDHVIVQSEFPADLLRA